MARRPTDAPLPAHDVDTADWPAQAADTIERVVQGVRDKTTGPAITAARWVVASMFLLFAGTMILIVLAIAAARALNVYLPDAVFGEDHMWAADAIIGIVLLAIGAVLLHLRHPSSADDR